MLNFRKIIFMLYLKYYYCSSFVSSFSSSSASRTAGLFASPLHHQEAIIRKLRLASENCYDISHDWCTRYFDRHRFFFLLSRWSRKLAGQMIDLNMKSSCSKLFFCDFYDTIFWAVFPKYSVYSLQMKKICIKIVPFFLSFLIQIIKPTIFGGYECHKCYQQNELKFK